MPTQYSTWAEYEESKLEPDNVPTRTRSLYFRNRTEDIARKEWERRVANDPEGAAEFLDNEQRKRVWDAAREEAGE